MAQKIGADLNLPVLPMVQWAGTDGRPISQAKARKELVLHMKKPGLKFIVCFLGLCSLSLALESGMYRLLSVSDSEKIILVSQPTGKAKYLLDASSAKITINGKAAEFRELKAFSVIQVKMELKKFSKNGIGIDGSATEIRITNADKVK